jgi:hypothetical protein
MTTHYASLFFTLVMLVFGSVTANAITPQKILDNGPDGQKLVFVVVGDGYAAGDQTKFVNDVNNLVINGVLTHDFYRENIRAFNVYRLDLVSNLSGVRQLGTSSRDTALQTIYSGLWNRCWIEESNNTSALLNAALNVIPKYDYVLVVQNESRFGGCRRGNRLYVTSGVGWEVVAHEYGHGIGGLFDEYSDASRPFYTGQLGPIVNNRNCTTFLNPNTVSWSALIPNPNLIVPLPTIFNAANMDANATVGIFEGCATYQRGIYRPVSDCRMKTNSPQFCPVCRAIMGRSVERYLGSAPVASAFGFGQESRALSSLVFSNHASVVHPDQDSPQATGTYLHIVMKVSKNNSPEVISMTEVQGALPLRDEAASSVALIVNENNQPTSVEFLPEDPFLVRGFEDPGNPKGEYTAQVDSATITIDIPNDIGEAASGRVSLELSRVQGAAAGNIQVATPDATLLQQLKTSDRLQGAGRLSESKLKKAATDMKRVKSIP